jgi:proteasome lid subunit RPN8/RPN11
MFFRSLFLVLVLGLAGCSTRDPLAEISIPTNAAYSSEQAAIFSALKLVKPKAAHEEFGGAIYIQNGKYHFTSGATSYDYSSYDIKIEIPKGTKIVALYHTHPDEDLNDMFSSPDIKMATFMKVRSYIGVFGKNVIRVYDPKIDKCDRFGEDCVAFGRKVGVF